MNIDPLTFAINRAIADTWCPHPKPRGVSQVCGLCASSATDRAVRQWREDLVNAIGDNFGYIAEPEHATYANGWDDALDRVAALIEEKK